MNNPANPVQLNQQYAIPSQLAFVSGACELPFIEIRNAAAYCRVSLYGGQVLSFRPANNTHDLLFLSEHAHFSRGKAIKGGVPVCWPWFGADPDEQGRPTHGFARTRMWSVAGTERLADDATRVTLVLRDDADSRKIWPHAFELRLLITVGATLDLQLVTRNAGNSPMRVTQALHTYFSIGDIAQVRVEGLDGRSYLDKVQGFARAQQDGDVHFDREVDRIYLAVDDNLRIVDPARARTIGIHAQGSSTAVVWNPWRDVARTMSDLADDDYRRFVCVETANAADEVITLEAGAEYLLRASYWLDAMR